MLNEKMSELGKKRSAIRELFEFGKMRKAQVGEENVYDFSLGNPNIPTPDCITDTLLRLIKNEDATALHGYTSAQGDIAVREAIANDLNKRFGFGTDKDRIFMTVGAAASLTVCINALTNENDEIIVFAPFFPEYRVFVESAKRKVKQLLLRESDFQIDFDALKSALTENVSALIVNSPNNPTGSIFTEDTVKELAAVLCEAEEKYGHPIYLISDEPYRELVYGDVKLPFIPNYYKDTVICYSYSKSLSVPGERIGYVAVGNCDNADDVYAAVAGAARALGYVCAPSLWQKVIAENPTALSDVSEYEKNRDLLYSSLTSFGYKAVKPDGAFYLFIKCPEYDANAFCERAKKFDLLLVPSDSFGINGYARISYCVSYDMIKRSLPAFKALMDTYRS